MKSLLYIFKPFDFSFNITHFIMFVCFPEILCFSLYLTFGMFIGGMMLIALTFAVAGVDQVGKRPGVAI